MAVEHECKNCKKTFIGKVNGKYCSKKCKKEFEKTTPAYKEAQRSYDKKRRERMRLANAQRNQGKCCRNCQVDLSRFPRAKFFCSRRCQQQFYNATQRARESKMRYEQNNKERLRQWRLSKGLAGKLQKRIQRKYANANSPKATARVCGVCKNEFVGTSEFCSGRCYSKNYRTTLAGKKAHARYYEKIKSDSERLSYQREYGKKYRNRPGEAARRRERDKKYSEACWYIAKSAGIPKNESELIELAKLSLRLKRVLRGNKDE